MPRFVLLRHVLPESDRRGSHWDLMLEREGLSQEHRLATWSLRALPTAWAARLGLEEATTAVQTVLAKRLEDHRAAYLDYEGPLTRDRGEVRRYAGGTIEWLASREDFYQVRLLAPTPLAGVLELQENAAWEVRWA